MNPLVLLSYSTKSKLFTFPYKNALFNFFQWLLLLVSFARFSSLLPLTSVQITLSPLSSPRITSLALLPLLLVSNRSRFHRSELDLAREYPILG